MRYMRIITGIAAVLATIILFGSLFGSNGAPQQAAGAAVAAALVIIPYCVTALQMRKMALEVAVEHHHAVVALMKGMALPASTPTVTPDAGRTA